MDKFDLVFADLYGVAVLKLLLLDGLAVHIGAIGAVQVFQKHIGARHLHHRMLTTDGKVIDHDVVVRTATQGCAVFGQLHFLDDHAINRNNHFRHGRLLWNLKSNL